MPFHTLTGGQRDCLAVVQQGVEAYQNARVRDARRLLKLTNISIANCLNQRRIHIANALTVFLLLDSQPADCNFNQLLQHIVFRFIIVIHAGQRLIDRRWVHNDVGDFRQLAEIAVDADIRAAVGNELADQIRDLRVGTASHQSVGQMQTCRYRLGTHGLAGARLTAKQEVPHGLAGRRCQLGVLTDSYYLAGNDVPVRQLRNHVLFAAGQRALAQRVFPNEVSMVINGRCGREAGPRRQDGELTIDSSGRRIASAVDSQLGQAGDIARCRDRNLDACHIQRICVLHTAIDVVA